MVTNAPSDVDEPATPFGLTQAEDPQNEAAEQLEAELAHRLRTQASFNPPRTPYPQDKLAHQLFEAQVERTPQALAAIYQGQSLTYTELNQRANQLARYLRLKDIRPEQLVGLYVERGLEMVVGVLGI